MQVTKERVETPGWLPTPPPMTVTVSPAGGRVTLESGPEGGQWILAVTDEGPGLPAEQLARVFERFVRFKHEGAELAPSRGHGLGLAICKRLTELMGGTIGVASVPGRMLAAGRLASAPP